jgi:hypothetical protein
MSISGFWTAAPKVDPARQFRFRVLINGEFAWWAKTCDKPKINIPVLGKDEYYLGSNLPDTKPGEIVDFQPITMTFIDPKEGEGLSEWGLSLIAGLSFVSGKCFPRIDGAAFKESFSGVVIEQIDHTGKAIERWTLNGPFPTSIDFGSLDYGSDDFVTITITWEYTSFSYASAESNVLVAATPKSKKDAKKLDGDYI